MALAPSFKPLPLPSPPVKHTLQLSTSRRFSCTCSAVAQPDSSSTSLSSSSVIHRPAVILPGLGNNTGDYEKLALTLQGYGVSSVVANVSRIDWLRNAAGLVDPNYWRGTLQPRPVLDWYLIRVDEAVNEALKQSQGGSLSIIGHSAGGWLARVYMEEFKKANVSLLLTLGSPLQYVLLSKFASRLICRCFKQSFLFYVNFRPPPKGLPGVVDQTRGLLYYVEKNCRKAVYTPELRYVCIAGRYIQGSRFFDDSDSATSIPVALEQSVPNVAVESDTSTLTSTGATFRTRFVCGQADVWGDGVVPEVSAHLEGALNISLEGVYHSPVGSDDESRPWYGSPAVVEQWVHHLLN
ncbi:GPI inositol-deacylase PGAP1-like protein [Cynara cardunculus var. scolymus]|uniref:GPI inositol-deacylase n=1 Tax=Cynara cardunculus var. scolymus TaxID=59895 RepID=A0A118K056_CYNCS|nr:GPI inositol-deacylase PGAP1-like protein [Cynara cardunculus var. scolymus]